MLFDDDKDNASDEDLAAAWAAAMDESEDGGDKEGDSDADLADAWAAAMDESGAGGGEEDEELDSKWAAAMHNEAPEEADPFSGFSGDMSTLSQEEIDSLLGFDNAETAQEKTGIELMLEQAVLSYEHLPMLEIIFDRFVRMLSTSLRNFTSDNVDVDIQNITSMRFGEYVNTIPMPAILSIFKAIEWENFGIVTFNGALVYSMVDVLFGGRRSNKPIRIEGRPYTTIERNVITSISKIVLMDMSDAFDPLSPTTLHLDRLETNPRFATIVHPSDTVILIRLRVDMEDRGGNIEIMLPMVTLEPIKPLLTQSFIGEKYEKDDSWHSYLSKELAGADMELQAVLGKKHIRLKDLGALKVGKTLLLDNRPDQEIILTGGGKTVFKGKPGRLDDDMAVVITESLQDRKQPSAQTKQAAKAPESAKRAETAEG